MSLPAKVLEIIFNSPISTKKRAEKRLEIKDRILANETNEILREAHQKERDKLSFQSLSGFRAEHKHIEFLTNLNNNLGGNRWHLIRDAYKILKKQESEMDLTVTDFQRKFARILFISVFSVWGIAIVFGFVVAMWHIAEPYAVYFLVIYALAILGSVLTVFFAPYQAMIHIDKILKQREIENDGWSDLVY